MPHTTLFTLLVRVAAAMTKPVQFRGYWHCIRFLQKILPSRDEFMEMSLSQDSHFIFSLRDPYWSRILSRYFSYEKEIYRFLDQQKSVPYILIDCGANLGYWSILASSASLGSHEALAIEPAPDTFLMLEKNCDRNGKRFQILNKAVMEQSNQSVQISLEIDHASRSVTNAVRSKSLTTASVNSISIDDLLKTDEERYRNPLLLKLDIEGAEISALCGGKAALARDNTAVLYEEHGVDSECKVTKWILENLPDYSIFFLNHDQDPTPIRSTKELQRKKLRRSVGYNMLMIKPRSIWNSYAKKN